MDKIKSLTHFKKKSKKKEKVFNLRFFNALKRIPQPIPPLWFMRQAGRYHRHYQNLRKTYSFMDLCKNPELSAKVALGPIQDFDFDVAILFSDLLFPLEAMGLELHYRPAPFFPEKMDIQKLKALRSLESMVKALQFQKEALLCTRDILPKNKSLIGFIGGPWTLFTYAVKEEHKISFLQDSKEGIELYKMFVKTLLPLLIKNIQLQLEGGAEVVMVFDSSVGELSQNLFSNFVVSHLKKMAFSYPSKLVYYGKALSVKSLKEIINFPWGGFGFDHSLDMKDLPFREMSGLFQGNFDPSLLLQNSNSFKASLKTYLSYWLNLSKEERKGWVCGLGHGVLPKTPEVNVKNFVEIVRKTFAK